MALALGFHHGVLTSIVNSPCGVLGNAAGLCDGSEGSDDINPYLPDYRQLTGSVSVLGVWSPVYGKINFVSEFSLSLQAYFFGGLGAHGTRSNDAKKRPDSYVVSNTGFFEGGMLSDPFMHLMFGGGVRLFLLDWLNLRMEYRSLVYFPSFDFYPTQPEIEATSYPSWLHFVQVGLGFVIF